MQTAPQGPGSGQGTSPEPPGAVPAASMCFEQHLADSTLPMGVQDRGPRLSEERSVDWGVQHSGTARTIQYMKRNSVNCRKQRHHAPRMTHQPRCGAATWRPRPQNRRCSCCAPRHKPVRAAHEHNRVEFPTDSPSWFAGCGRLPGCTQLQAVASVARRADRHLARQHTP